MQEYSKHFFLSRMNTTHRRDLTNVLATCSEMKKKIVSDFGRCEKDISIQ